MTRILATAALAFALAATAFTPSNAQMSDRPGQMMGMMGGSCMMGQSMMNSGMMGSGMSGSGMMGMGNQGGLGMRSDRPNMTAMVDGRLAYLKSELKITDQQDSAWTGYADAVKGRVGAMQDMRETMMKAMQTGSAMERMDARIGAMEAMLDALKAVQPATEKLYAALSDDQKKVADQLIGLDCGAM